MGHLIPSDFERLIQDVTLQQIISGNVVLKFHAELAAVEEARSYLRAKYDVDLEFTNSQVYNPQSTYGAGNRIYLDGPAYSAQSLYTPGQLTVKDGIVYQCIVAITVAEAFNVSKWVSLGPRYTIFYAQYPYSVFKLINNYNKGDKTFYKGHIYTCKIPTSSIDHATLIQYETTSNVPYKNVFPDDTKNGVQYWNDDGLYAVPPGNLLTVTPPLTFTIFQAREDMDVIADTSPGFVSGNPTYQAPPIGQPGCLVGWSYSLERVGQGTLQLGVNYNKNYNGFTLIPTGNVPTPNERFVLHFVPIANQPVPAGTTGLNASQIIMTYFTNGDNRNQQMLLYVLDILIYHLYRRIPPAIVPDIRIVAYRSAIEWLKSVSKGNDVIADIEKNQPAAGKRISGGSNIKQINSY
jgi:hypothetical protein